MSSASSSLPPALQRAVHHATAWLEGLDRRAVATVTELATLRARMDIPFPERGTDPVRVIDDLVAMTEGRIKCSAGMSVTRLS